MANFNTNLSQNNIDLQSILDTINALPDAGSGEIELPELSNPGSASNLLSGKQLINQNGGIVTGSMPDNGSVTKTLDTSTASFTIPAGYHNGSGKVSISTEAKTATPTKSTQTITPTSGKVLSTVTVNPIPAEYITTSDATAAASDILASKTAYVNGAKVTGNIQTKTASNLTANGATVTVPAGYYASQATKSVATVARAETTFSVTKDDTNDKLTITASNDQSTGYVTGANKTATKTITLTANGAAVTASDGINSISKSVATATQATPSITVSSDGLITATATQTAGYVSAGTKSGTNQLTTQAAKTITPTKSSQTAVAKNVYTTGIVTVDAIPNEYIITTDATATATEVLSGKTAYVKGSKVTGSMANNGAISKTMDGLNTKSITVPAGYTSGGTVSLDNTIDNEAMTQSDLIDQIIATANSLPEAGEPGGGTAEINLQDKTITENGVYTADSGYDGFGTITVQVAGSTPADPRDAYQRVEYITSAAEGTYPYIITDFIADNSCGMEVIASFPILQDRIPMGSRADANATRFYVAYPMSASSVYYGFNTGSSISCALKVDTIYRLQTNFLNSRLICVYEQNGTRKANTSISATLTDQGVPVSIFGYNSGSSGAVTSKREYKFYNARCSRGHEVVREYIPCYRKSDGVVGVYEKFTGEFLTSEISAGFIAGAEIDW